METLTAKHFERPEGPKAAPRIVKFVNFSKEPFTWTLNKIPYTFQPGEENAKYMEYPIALHFAKHLVNRELLKRGRENDTSPKNMHENPYFMEIFNKVVTPIDDDIGEADQTKLEVEATDRNMKHRLAQKKGGASKRASRAPAKSKEDVAKETGQHEHTRSTDIRKESDSKDAKDADYEILDDGDDDED